MFGCDQVSAVYFFCWEINLKWWAHLFYSVIFRCDLFLLLFFHSEKNELLSQKTTFSRLQKMDRFGSRPINFSEIFKAGQQSPAGHNYLPPTLSWIFLLMEVQNALCRSTSFHQWIISSSKVKKWCNGWSLLDTAVVSKFVDLKLLKSVWRCLNHWQMTCSLPYSS